MEAENVPLRHAVMYIRKSKIRNECQLLRASLQARKQIKTVKNIFLVDYVANQERSSLHWKTLPLDVCSRE